MHVVVKGEEADRLIEDRRRLGIDLWDEVENGIYIVKPSPGGQHQHIANVVARWIEEQGWFVLATINVGDDDDFRIPDIAAWRDRPSGELPTWFTGPWVPDLVVEVLSPSNDAAEMELRSEFYALQGVDDYAEIDLEGRFVRGTDHPVAVLLSRAFPPDG